MKFTRTFSHFRSVKFAPFAIISLFFLTNFTGLLFSPAFAPSVSATSQVETIPADIPLSGDCDLDWIIFRAGKRAGVDPRFIHAVIKQESRYDPRAVSPVGARGLMQMMPATAKRFGLKNPEDAAANVEAGTKYLKWLLKRFGGDVTLALAGYNAGEGAVAKYKGVPPYNETQNYVKKIVGTYGKTYHPILPPEDAKFAFHLTNESASISAAL
ncbi:MAG: lytic transglycosylase domain-containing protein [Pyrinomonadaceae bacterium]